jgi:hypothetical protein
MQEENKNLPVKFENLPITTGHTELIGIHDNIENEGYQKMPGISRSSIELITSKSPLHYLTKLNEPDEPPTQAMAFGAALHDAVLLPKNLDRYAFEPTCDKRTKEGKAAFEKFLKESEGKIIVPRKGKDSCKETLVRVSEGIRKHPEISRFFDPKYAIFEQSIFWHDPETGLLCKCRPDALIETNEAVIIADVKTTEDASKDEFNKQIAKRGYHLQAAHYINGVSEIIDVNDRPIIFVFVACEKEPPYDFAVYDLNQKYLDIAQTTLRNGLLSFAEILKTNKFPVYSKKVQTLEAPGWLRS